MCPEKMEINKFIPTLVKYQTISFSFSYEGFPKPRLWKQKAITSFIKSEVGGKEGFWGESFDVFLVV